MRNITHIRKGAKVFTIEGTLEFNGTPENARKGLYDNTSVKYKRCTCTARFYNNRGINRAKRYVRENNLVSRNE